MRANKHADKRTEYTHTNARARTLCDTDSDRTERACVTGIPESPRECGHLRRRISLVTRAHSAPITNHATPFPPPPLTAVARCEALLMSRAHSRCAPCPEHDRCRASVHRCGLHSQSRRGQLRVGQRFARRRRRRRRSSMRSVSACLMCSPGLELLNHSNAEASTGDALFVCEETDA